FVVGDIGDPRLFELQHIAEGSIRMRETESRDADLRVELNGVAAREFAEIDLGSEQILHLDREKGVLYLIRHQLDQRIPWSSFAIDHEAIFRGKRRRKKW